MGRLASILPSLHQLHQLRLYDYSFAEHRIGYDLALSGLAALTNLTRLALSEVATGEALQHLPASLLELEMDSCPCDDEGPLQLGHLTALTQLTTDEYVTLRQHHVLPPNLLELTVGNLTSATCLLPLKQLGELSLLNTHWEVAPADQLQQLSSLTALTAVHLAYWACTEDIDTAAAGWQALKLRSLQLWPGCHGSFARNTLLQLSTLTGLQSLRLYRCGLDALQPEQLAAALGNMRNLSFLMLDSVHWGQAEDDAANASALALLLQGLASRWRRMRRLASLTLEKQRVGRDAAAALSKMHGLAELKVTECQLENCSAIQIALGLKPWLKELDLSNNTRLTDACLPALKHAVPGLQEFSVWGCSGLTREGMEQYILGDTGDSADGSDSGSDSESE